ncbi:hypothetical protein AVEN_204684-1 [Araneus ventricosus]|uniref:Uncharacterized protein n=1 Tax=Araneus ventricosus TaxID=182803 RepID=A0A4Y2U184_ARAVE|nr:hypothetical protein AVEN_204684-1 [Araneus ventricosus]
MKLGYIYSDTNAKSEIQYLSRDQNRRDLTPSTTVPHPKGVMVWMGISANGATKPRFVQHGPKINSEYYIQRILKTFLKDITADCTQMVMLFSIRILPHPSHASRVTQKFLPDQQVQFLRPTMDAKQS